MIPKLYNGHNKTFFFIGSEIVRYQQGNTYTATVPNPTELSGNFSGDTNSAGGQITIYNPFLDATEQRRNRLYPRSFPGEYNPARAYQPHRKEHGSLFPGTHDSQRPDRKIELCRDGRE